MSGACGRTIHPKPEQRTLLRSFSQALMVLKTGAHARAKKLHGANLLHQQLCRMLGLTTLQVLAALAPFMMKSL